MISEYRREERGERREERGERSSHTPSPVRADTGKQSLPPPLPSVFNSTFFFFFTPQWKCPLTGFGMPDPLRLGFKEAGKRPAGSTRRIKLEEEWVLCCEQGGREDHFPGHTSGLHKHSGPRGGGDLRGGHRDLGLAGVGHAPSPPHGQTSPLQVNRYLSRGFIFDVSVHLLSPLLNQTLTSALSLHLDSNVRTLRVEAAPGARLRISTASPGAPAVIILKRTSAVVEKKSSRQLLINYELPVMSYIPPGRRERGEAPTFTAADRMGSERRARGEREESERRARPPAVPREINTYA
ncbi:hypothetical protein EYF80_056111 [Liparis tanakae]|uniref:Uncharacterized protein n=1 Tax=Liparis tanakae TaxID=230148 RepID=A0A4Z2EZC1_9TELE|nr:hypothetical protein EYF80_056111 [Liparis tanakae]